MKDAIYAVLATELKDPVHWACNEAYFELTRYIYHVGVWDKDFRDKIDAILRKDIATLTKAEICTYLTFIYCMDRTQEGCV